MPEKILINKTIKKISGEYNTPLYIYDRKVIQNNYRCLKDSLYPGASLYYAMKCNPLLGICEILTNEGAGIEVASAGEMKIALESGIDGSKIIFTSPGKTESEIDYAVKNNIRIINIDSLDEAEIVDRIAKSNNKNVNIGLRINPSVSFSNAKIKMTGIASQFGFEEESLDNSFFDRLKQFDNLRLVGIQIYMGTQMLNPEDIIKNTEYTLNLAIRLSNEFSFDLEYVNCGGGFGVKYFKNESELDLNALKNGMQDLYDKLNDKLENTDIVFESGRFIMASSGIMVTRVLYRKESKGQRFLVCDGGSNIHSSAAFLGRFVRNNFPLYAIGDSGNEIETTVCGPLCTSLDVIGQKVMLSENIRRNDLIVIEQSGAYGYTYSPISFLSHETPAEILVDGEKHSILRERGKNEDYLEKQRSIKNQEDI